jgi:hydroxylysine kinase
MTFTANHNGPPDVLNASLSTPPPEIADKEVDDFIASHYGIAGKARSLNGERDCIFHVQGHAGSDFVFKVSNPNEDPLTSQMQTAVLLHLAAAAPTLPVQRVVNTLNGETEVRFPLQNGQVCRARMLTYIPGEVLRFAKRSPAQRRNLGRVSAEIGLVLRDFKHPAAKRELAWDIQYAGRLRSLVPSIPVDAARQNMLLRCFDDFDARVTPLLPKLRAQIVHNDFNRNNIIVDASNHERITGVLDFGDMVHTALINDVTIGASNQLPETENPLSDSFEFVAGYHETVALTPEELGLMYDLISARVLMSIVITEWRAMRFPERREHICRNTPANWLRLGRLQEISRESALEALLRACDHKE